MARRARSKLDREANEVLESATAALPDRLRLLAWIHAVFTPRSLASERTRGLLEDAALKPYGGGPGSAAVDPQALADLVESGIAERRADGGLGVAPDLGLRLMREALAAGALGPILAAVARLKQRELDAPLATNGGVSARLEASDRDHRTSEVLLRGYLLAGDLAAFRALQGTSRASGREFALLAEPFAEEALRALPRSDLPAARAACLDHVIDTAAPADALIAFCNETSEAPLDHAPAIAYIRVLQGRFDAADAVFDALPPPAAQSVPALAGRASTRALTAMLRGEDEQARGHIEETLRLLRGGHKRLAWPDDRAFSFALLALARLDEPDGLELLQSIDATHSYQHSHRAGLELAQYAAAIKAKSGLPYNAGRGRHGIWALFTGLQSCWLGQLPNDAPPLLVEIGALHHRAVVNGFDWVAAECGEVLRCWAREAQGAAAEQADQKAQGHSALGTATLTTLTTPTCSWPEALATLEELAVDDEEAAQEPESASDGRLVWTLRQSAGEIALTARAQRRGGNGAWTRGKQYGAKRLAAESTKMDFLLPQDKDAIAAAAQRRNWHKQEDFFGVRSLHALAGHPHVLDEQGQPVEVVQREPELSVDADPHGGVVVRVTPHRSGTDGAYSVAVSPGRCEVTFYNARHRRLCRVVPQDGLRLPSDAKARFLRTVPALASTVRVASSLADVAEDESATPTEADAEPWVRLEPLGAGLSVALEVEPISDSGVCYAPGEGGAVVFARRDGETLRAERDLQQERHTLDQLVSRCPPLASMPTTLRPLALPEADDCLDLLELLEGCGARCRWPRGESMRVVARASTASMRLYVRTAAQWLQMSAQLPVDEQRALDLRQLLQLAEQQAESRFLPLGNGEFMALTKTFRRQLGDLASVASAVGAKDGVRLPPLAALAVQDLIEGAELEADDGWEAMRERMQSASTIEPVVPSTLQAELRPYQLEGYQWLSRLSRWGVGACLADDMGLGKTIQTLAVLLERGPDGPALVVAPMSVVPNWLAEARRFAPTLRARPYAGAAAGRKRLLDGLGALDLVVVTYGLLQNDADQLADVAWHTVVLDEAQAIKNPAAKRSQAAKQLRADFRLITTGTPVQNNLMDLHSLFGFANPGLLGSQRQFRTRFALPIERDRNAVARVRLRRLIEPFVLRRLKTDVLDDLPPRTEITLHVQLSAEEASLYEALRQRAVDELAGGGGGQMRLLAHLTRLRLACCSPRLVLDADDAPPDLPQAVASAKLATFATTLAELLDNRHKVLVFSQFVTHLALVEQHLRETGVRYQYLDGATSAKERAARIAAFQAGDGDVFLISLTAGGVGLNLTAADYVIHMDPWWNPAVEDQASDRAHRIGQTRPVTIYRLVAAGTIEEQIVDLHHRKRDLADQLLEATDAPTRLDMDEMMALLTRPFSG